MTDNELVAKAKEALENSYSPYSHFAVGAAENLIKIKNEIKASGGIAPDSLCVICGLSNAAYQRPDGVFVVPITALRN